MRYNCHNYIGKIWKQSENIYLLGVGKHLLQTYIS